MAVRLRYLSHDLEMPEGQFVVGRSADCQLSLDDGLVSRRHALLTVRGSTTTIEDLGSRNGVKVNAQKIDGPLALNDGDEIEIGKQKLVIFGVTAPPERQATPSVRRARLADTMMAIEELHEDADVKTRLPGAAGTGNTAVPDRRVHALSLVGAVADKALALNRAEEAVRILKPHLIRVVVQLESGNGGLEEGEPVARYAVKLAKATGEGQWVETCLRVYTAVERVMPTDLVDELYAVVRHVQLRKQTLDDYLDKLAALEGQLGPAERFVVQRIRGLVPLASLK